jgi:hypothetical protein
MYRFLATKSILIASQHTLNYTYIMLRKAAMIILLIMLVIAITHIANNLTFHKEFAYAQEEQEISASGTGTIKCFDNSKTYEGKIYFLAIKGEGPIYGTYEIIVSNTSLNNSLNNVGSLINGNISSSQYGLVGSGISDNICGSDTSTTVTIRGGCGPESMIDVATPNGYSAKFLGEVSCPILKNIGSPIAQAAGPVEVAEGEKAVLSGAGSIDPDGDILRYEWKQIGGMLVDLNNPNSIEAEFTAPSVEENDIVDFELTVEDTKGSLDTDRISVLVYKEQPLPQQSPIAQAAGPVEVAEGEKAVLSGAGSIDPDGDILRYEWKQIGGMLVDLNNPNSIEAEFTAPSIEENSTLTFELTVDDGHGGTDTNSMNVKVYKKKIQLNEPPKAVADASPQTLSSAEDIEVILDGSQSSDPEGDNLSYLWKQISGPSVDLSNSDEARSTFDTQLEVEEDTTLTFELTVDDGHGGTDTDNVDVIIVKAEEPAPEPEQPPSPPPSPSDGGEETPEPEPEPAPEPEQPPPSDNDVPDDGDTSLPSPNE